MNKTPLLTKHVVTVLKAATEGGYTFTIKGNKAIFYRADNPLIAETAKVVNRSDKLSRFLYHPNKQTYIIELHHPAGTMWFALINALDKHVVLTKTAVYWMITRMLGGNPTPLIAHADMIIYNGVGHHNHDNEYRILWKAAAYNTNPAIEALIHL